MDKLQIRGKAFLTGSISVSGSKNAALPIMIASLLSENGLYLKNLPALQDTLTMKKLLENFGVKIKEINSQTFFDSTNINNSLADYDLVRKMRASILVLGPLISRFKKAKISLPGGCAIGTRPIDIHLNGLEKLGVKFSIENGFVSAEVKKNLTGDRIKLSFPSVGATENIMMAASKAVGETIIENAAREPEIEDLAKCLNKMGAKIIGAGTTKIIIEGVKKLSKSEHTIMSDRIVAGTYVIAAVMLNNEFIIKKIKPDLLSTPLEVLQNMGAKLEIGNDFIKVLPSSSIKGIALETKPYPGFPTDLQAQIMALMSVAKGNSQIKEMIFENRFMHVSELNRLGASIKINKDVAFIEGERRLKGAKVMASDLRASVSLVLAGLYAEGKTIINRLYHLDRGYEKIEETLGKCGPKITRLK
jgi:UDP-N-acetylglucosamine 1-carboxyvinyltransferase